MKTQKLKQTVLAAAFGLAALVSTSAWADVVVVVGAKSTVSTLAGDQVSQIFLGKTNSFPGGTPAIPIDQADGAAPRSEFYTKVANKSAAQLNAYRSNMIFSGKGQAPKEVAGNAEVKKLLADNPNMIGYIDKSAVDGSVKAVLTP